MRYQDIPGWFPDESAVTLARLMEKHSVNDVVEVGAFLGRSTVFFAERCALVAVIDPFKMSEWVEGQNNGLTDGLPDDFSQNFRDNIRACGVEDKVTVNPILPVLYTDLVYIDGAHDYASVKKDIETWMPHARKIICGDDYDDNWPGVKQAVDEAFPEVKLEGRIWYVLL
jgi:hypothetical protein